MNSTPNSNKPDPSISDGGNVPDDPLTDHAYDGIQEYDNPTPGWWTYLWIATIVFGFFYWLVFTLAPKDAGYALRYEIAAARDMKKTFGELGELNPDEPTLISFLTEAEKARWLKFGESLFKNKCSTCHGSEGTGINGANLTDEKYIHVRQITDIVDVISNGRNNGAMPKFESKDLNPTEMTLVAAYVASLRGTNKPGGKPAEPNAVAIDPWPTNRSVSSAR